MRFASLCLLGFALVGAGCGNDNNGQNADLSGTVGADLSAEVGDLAGGGGPDLASDDGGLIVITDGGSNGATCTTACDCLPGLACAGGICRQGTVPVYCCNSTSCVNGDVCQNPSGTYGRCGTNMPDLGTFDYCDLINCSTAAGGMNECTRAGCSMCATGTNGMSCAR